LQHITLLHSSESFEYVAKLISGFSTAVKELASVLQICRQSRSSIETLTMHCLRQ